MDAEGRLRIAVLCPSDIASRRFMPALSNVAGVSYAGVGVATEAEREAGLPERSRLATAAGAERVARQRAAAERFREEHGGLVFDSFGELLESPEVDAVYIPLPPALHHYWGRRALEAGKHVMLEKPFATSARDTDDLLALSRDRGLAVHENYMFAFHSQISYLLGRVREGAVGDVRLVRVDFGFPFRGNADFRYVPELGGGALLDCGGYTLKLASMLLGRGVRMVSAAQGTGRGLPVDLFGSATLRDGEGRIAQVSFGMDNEYRCDVDVWGSAGTLRSGRILTAPAGFEPTFELRRGGAPETVRLPADDSFAKSIGRFVECANDPAAAEAQRAEIAAQAALVEQFRRLASSD